MCFIFVLPGTAFGSGLYIPPPPYFKANAKKVVTNDKVNDAVSPQGKEGAAKNNDAVNSVPKIDEQNK